MFEQDGVHSDERLPSQPEPRRPWRPWLRTFGQGALVSLLVNVLTVLGWLVLGPWPPAIANVLLALIILGVYGLDDKWAFPLGYWTIEVPAAFLWMASWGLLGLISGGTGIPGGTGGVGTP
ncbi:MAG: hypothetical protein ACYC5Y_06620 [Symbiobacteriia bacterium]